MGFSTASITSVSIGPDGQDLAVSWTSSAAAGTWYQAYVDRRLVWSGQARRCRLPYPGKTIQVDVGTVADLSERHVDYSGSLPSAPSNRATIAWRGGTYLDPSGAGDVKGFRIHASATAGGAVDYTTILATVPAYTGDVVTDGFGSGGYGSGGFGMAASDYSWVSPVLGPGTWTFAIVPFDAAGNKQGTPTTGNVAITGPPRPPAPDETGQRLTYTYNNTTRVATLNWSASPAATGPDGHTWG